MEIWWSFFWQFNNYGNSNPELKERIQKDLDEFLEKHPGLKAEDIPSDLLTASGSGLDPHISPKSRNPDSVCS